MSFEEFSESGCHLYGEHGNRIFTGVHVRVRSDGLSINGRLYSRGDISSYEHDESTGRVLVKTSSETLDIRYVNRGALLDALSALALLD